MLNILEIFLRLFYPPRCACCGSLMEFEEEHLICPTCLFNLVKVEGKTCSKCGRPISNSSEHEKCKICMSKNTYLDKNYGVFEYTESYRPLIFRFKFGKHKEVGKTLATLIVDNVDINIFNNVDCFVPVPMHKIKEKKRGFNQATVICKELSKLTGIPVEENVLIRTVNTTAQMRLGTAKRQANLKGSMKFNENFQKKVKCFMLIDDIYTSGSTMSECAKALKENLPCTVLGLSVSIVVHREGGERDSN